VSGPAEIEDLRAYWRAANYLGAAQVYLQNNFLLEEPLEPEHIKPRLLGHWGTVPGINLVLACSGVYPTTEALAAAWLLRRELPELRMRVVNITDLLIVEPDSYHPHGLTPAAFDDLFTPDRPVIYNFQGYPSAVQQPLFERPRHERFVINGYREEGRTTTRGRGAAARVRPQAIRQCPRRSLVPMADGSVLDLSGPAAGRRHASPRATRHWTPSPGNR
jgi:phosphoketolase